MSQSFRPIISRTPVIWRAALCLIFSLLLGLALLASQAALASDKRIALLIPHTTSKAQLIYDEMYAGLQSMPGAQILRFNLDGTADPQQVQQWLDEQNPQALIAIGKSAHGMASGLDVDVPVVVGGMGSTPEGVSGVTLAGDPEEFFANAKALAPKVLRVHLVFNQEINGWWIEQAKAAADRHGLQFITHEATSVRSGAKLYKKLLKSAKRDEDAIWIPLVSIVPSKTVLPMVLRQAWDKHLVVFTNSPAHARQGALFSLYPDNKAMGAQLMELALEQVAQESQEPKTVLARNLNRAFNWRTASHLGLDYTLEEEAGFDRVYPLQ